MAQCEAIENSCSTRARAHGMWLTRVILPSPPALWAGYVLDLVRRDWAKRPMRTPIVQSKDEEVALTFLTLAGSSSAPGPRNGNSTDQYTEASPGRTVSRNGFQEQFQEQFCTPT